MNYEEKYQQLINRLDEREEFRQRFLLDELEQIKKQISAEFRIINFRLKGIAFAGMGVCVELACHYISCWIK